MKKNVVTKWRQEVGISATANLARFADPRLHVINVENDVKYLFKDLTSKWLSRLPPQKYTGFTRSSKETDQP